MAGFPQVTLVPRPLSCGRLVCTARSPQKTSRLIQSAVAPVAQAVQERLWALEWAWSTLWAMRPGVIPAMIPLQASSRHGGFVAIVAWGVGPGDFFCSV